MTTEAQVTELPDDAVSTTPKVRFDLPPDVSTPPSEAAAATTAATVPAVQYVTLTQLPRWLLDNVTTSITDAEGNVTTKKCTLSPKMLLALYPLFFWEYLNKHHVPGKLTSETSRKINDSTVVLTVEELTRLCELYFAFQGSFNAISLS